MVGGGCDGDGVVVMVRSGDDCDGGGGDGVVVMVRVVMVGVVVMVRCGDGVVVMVRVVMQEL